MDAIKSYLLSVIAAAIISGIISGMLGKTGAYGAIVKVMAGLFVTFTLLSPLVGIRIGDLSFVKEELLDDADAIVTSARHQADESVAAIIKEESQTYIMDKGTSLGAEIQVQVQLDPEDRLTPASVTISGNASPYAKRVLGQYIQDVLGIPKERQLWM